MPFKACIFHKNHERNMILFRMLNSYGSSDSNCAKLNYDILRKLPHKSIYGILNKSDDINSYN